MKALNLKNKNYTIRIDTSFDRYLTEIRQYDLISSNEEVELAFEIKQGNIKALDKMVKANLRFVVSVAKQYIDFGLPISDLVNEGNIGLIKAAQRFDATRGFKFISYAVWWVRQSILQSLNLYSKQFKIPLNIKTLFKQIKSFEEDYIQLHNTKPNINEIAFALNITAHKVKVITVANKQMAQIDKPISDDFDSSLSNYIVDSNKKNHSEYNVNKDSLKTDIKRVLSTLSPKEKYIIESSFGLNGNSKTINEIADNMNRTAERIRQIKRNALKKMNINLLKKYII